MENKSLRLKSKNEELKAAAADTDNDNDNGGGSGSGDGIVVPIPQPTTTTKKISTPYRRCCQKSSGSKIQHFSIQYPHLEQKVSSNDINKASCVSLNVHDMISSKDLKINHHGRFRILLPIHA